VEAREFTEGDDRCVIINGKLVDAKLSSIDLYCSFFSYKLEQSVFMILRSNGHSTSVLLSNSDDPQIAHLVVWNDVEPPGTFRVDKDKFMDTQKFKEAILDGKGESLDLVGKRNPPAFTMNELESVFHDNEARNEFMRGRRPHPTVTAGEKFYAFDCAFLSSIFGSLVKLFWIVG
jgi:hypothetical protein